MNRYQCSLVICGLIICSTAVGNSHVQDAEHALELRVQHLKKNSVHAQSSVEQLLALLDAELTLVEYLQTDETGMKVEDAVNQREHILVTSTLSVTSLYNLIMDVATYNPLLLSRTTYLNVHERRAYFKRIYDTLDHYYSEFQTMQYHRV